MYVATGRTWPDGHSIAATGLGVAGVGEASPLPSVVKMDFHNKGHVHPDNRCAQCDAPHPATQKQVRVPLGPGVFGSGKNAAELQFKLSGHRSGIEYDIKRVKRRSTWERVGGAWKRLELLQGYTPDDSGDGDEWLTPTNDSIFSMDAPGPRVLLPQSHGMTVTLSGGVSSSVDATDIVVRGSFVEFVLARDKTSQPSAMAPISPCYFWHNVVWLTRNAKNDWVLDRNRSKIVRGALSAQVLDSPPRP